mmetsp:Transcript_18323/g.39946  ORF Transcript_18323/g.39946 Transcript_18323/m.39946 type:complete len:123 (-) Transcript_18323:786-1154(-)
MNLFDLFGFVVVVNHVVDNSADPGADGLGVNLSIDAERTEDIHGGLRIGDNRGESSVLIHGYCRCHELGHRLVALGLYAQFGEHAEAKTPAVVVGVKGPEFADVPCAGVVIGGRKFLPGEGT